MQRLSEGREREDGERAREDGEKYPIDALKIIKSKKLGLETISITVGDHRSRPQLRSVYRSV